MQRNFNLVSDGEGGGGACEKLLAKELKLVPRSAIRTSKYSNGLCDSTSAGHSVRGVCVLSGNLRFPCTYKLLAFCTVRSNVIDIFIITLTL